MTTLISHLPDFRAAVKMLTTRSTSVLGVGEASPERAHSNTDGTEYCGSLDPGEKKYQYLAIYKGNLNSAVLG